MNNLRFLSLLLVSLVFVSLVWTGVCGQAHLHAQTLDEYVREGLRSNLAIRQKFLQTQRSSAEVAEARGKFLPSLTASVRMTELSGNVINLGNAINPAYTALNQLTGTSQFPTNLDLRLPLTRETKLSLVQPILQPAIYYNRELRVSLAESDEAALSSAKRQLVAEIKIAYLNYAKAVRLVELYSKTIPLVSENVRVNERLAANQKVTMDAVYRAKAELADINQKHADAEQKADAAKEYFNFLLNRSLQSPVELVSDSSLAIRLTASPEWAKEVSPIVREELKSIEYGIAASEAAVSINTASFFPNLSLAVDYGFQGNRFDFSGGQDFTTVSLVASWNIFNGLQDDAKRQQAVMESERLKTQYKDIQNQIALQIRATSMSMAVARNAIGTATERLTAAEASFKIATKKYAEGQRSQVEYLDAQTAFTNAGLNAIITQYDYYQKCAEFERAAGLYPLNITNSGLR
jgi:outer membrane protein TolC